MMCKASQALGQIRDQTAQGFTIQASRVNKRTPEVCHMTLGLVGTEQSDYQPERPVSSRAMDPTET